MQKIFIPSLRARAVIFSILTLFIFLGPFYKQVLHGESNYIRKWTMWSNTGKGLYNVRIYQKFQNGNTKYISYKNSLNLKTQIRGLKRIYSVNKLETILKLLCQKDYEDSFLILNLQRYRANGWVTIYNENTNICNNYSTVIKNLSEKKY